MSKFKTLIKTTLTPLALCLTLAITLPVMAKNGHHHRHNGMRLILSELPLTAAQNQDIKQIIRQTRAGRDLFSTDIKILKTELRDLVQSTEWDPAAVENAISLRQTLIQEKALQRANNKNQVWNLLTDPQQTEFFVLSNRLKAERKEMRDDGRGKGQGNKLKRLNLTETQLADVQSIKTTAKADGKEMKVKLKTYKQAERILVHSSNFNAEAWRTLNNEYQADFLAMAVLKAKTKHDIWNLFTPEQQTQAREKNEGKKRKHGKKGKRHQQQEST
jgi:Spy/CpxP family protein refolding chaperone